MLRRKFLLFIPVVSILGLVVFSILTLSAGATTQQEKKQQLEAQEQKLLEEKEALASKVREKNKGKVNDYKITIEEPEYLKKPFKWNKDACRQRHDLKSADTVWTAYGIVDSTGQWDEFVVWSEQNEDGKPFIGTMVTPDFFAGEYNAMYYCPYQSLGKIFITDIKDKEVYLKSDSGNKGMFNLETHEWQFDK